jgi:dTDP-4-amino-4,6-dideoxygalactose transaminase
MANNRIHLSPPHLSGREEQYLAEVLQSNWVAPAGPHLRRFEELLAARVGVEHAVAVSSGTAALHLALRCLNLQPDDEVICSTLTFCASANPIVYQRAVPVFIDSDTASWNMDPNLLADELRDCARRGKLPRAVVAVDIFGQSADMDAIVEVASRYEIPVIEDAAEALGATYKGASVGRAGWASFFSFNGNKIITTSGGGMLCSNDHNLIERARFLSTQARDPAPHYQHSTIGYNYRMSNVLAAIGIAQLEVLDEWVAARRRNFDLYRQHLEGRPGVSFMPEATYGHSNRWLTVIQVEPELCGATPHDLCRALEAQNIESRLVWKPLHLQPVFAACRHRGSGVAEKIFEAGLCLPSGSSLTAADLLRVVDCLQAATSHRGRWTRSRTAA